MIIPLIELSIFLSYYVRNIGIFLTSYVRYSGTNDLIRQLRSSDN